MTAVKKIVTYNTENKVFHKTYEYKGSKALKVFLKLSREKGKNTDKVYKLLKKELPELNLMEVFDYKVEKYTPFHIKTSLNSVDIEKTFNKKYISYFNYLLKEQNKEEILQAIEKWLYFENLFLENDYFHSDFNLDNIMISTEKRREEKRREEKRRVAVRFYRF